jgi:PKD repeat protein
MGEARRMLIAAVAVVVGLGATSAAAHADPGDIGSEGFSYAPVTGSPTQTKPESKLWFNDGAWWASMFSPAAGVHRIHRLDAATQRWIDTGTTLDPRNNANADVLWHAASRKLYVASHVFTQTGTAAAPGQAGRLYRYSYDPATARHTLDAGFPVLVNGARTESLVIDMDSTGRLWATWVQNAQVYANHTNGDDAAWGTPYVVSAFFGNASDDLSALVAFGGDRIGLMFSRQFFGDQRFFYFAVHRDGAGDTPADWTLDAIPGAPATNDHINLKADRAGRVFAAVKSAESAPTSRRTILLRRNADGTWSNATFGTVANGHTRPIVVLEDPGSLAHMFATCPQPPDLNADAGGDICEKTTSLDDLGFEPGIGTAIIRDAGSPELNDATSTKQPVNAATGLVVLANNPAAGVDTYWHRSLPVSTPAPPDVGASFAALPDPGDPLSAHFLDTSSGPATSWLWRFGDGTSSTARHPTHRYAQPGDYAVSLTAASATSTSTTTVTQPIPVPSPPGSAGQEGAGQPRAAQPPSQQRPPGRTAAGTTTARRWAAITLRRRYLRGGRVRLSGAVSPRLQGVRVTLQRRTRARRWSTVRSARLLPLAGGRSRFAFVVRRRARSDAYRVVVPEGRGRARSVSAALTVKRRR